MRRLAWGRVPGSLGLSVLLASGCGGSAFSASNASGGESNGGSGASGMTSAAGMTNAGGMTDAGGKSSGGATSAGSSSGGATSAGSSSGGGTSAGGNGAAGSAGSGGGTCATGTVTFTMVPAQSTGTAAFCSGCGVTWLTITDPNGKVVVIDRGCSTAQCGACMPTACPPTACLNQSVPADGLSRDWDETHWVDSTCGATALACAGAHCVAPGKYKAKMCAAKNTTPNGSFCSSGSSPVCTEVDFTLPGATTVQGVIGG